MRTFQRSQASGSRYIFACCLQEFHQVLKGLRETLNALVRKEKWSLEYIPRWGVLPKKGLISKNKCLLEPCLTWERPLQPSSLLPGCRSPQGWLMGQYCCWGACVSVLLKQQYLGFQGSKIIETTLISLWASATRLCKFRLSLTLGHSSRTLAVPVLRWQRSLWLQATSEQLDGPWPPLPFISSAPLPCQWILLWC